MSVSRPFGVFGLADIVAPSLWRTLAERLRAVRAEGHTVVMVILFVLAASAGVALLPGEDERVAMLERDGRTMEALQQLERRYEHGDASARTLYQLQQLYELLGDLPRARSTLEALAQKRPRDVAVQRRLALFYKSTQDIPAYLTALRSQIALRYSEEACRDLVAHLRLSGDAEAEESAIRDCRLRGYRRPDDLARLAGLTAARGDMAGAAAMLRSIDDLRRLRSEQDRLLLFGALVDLGQPREAQRRAVRWLKGARDDMLALTLIDRLADAGQRDTALALAREVGTPGDAVVLAVPELQIAQGDIAAARVNLQSWLERLRLPTDALAVRFVQAAIDAGDPVLATQGARRFGLSRLPPSDRDALLDALTDAGRADLARSLGPAALSASSPPTSAPVAAVRARARRGRIPTVEPAAPSRAMVADSELGAWRAGLWTRLGAGDEAQSAAVAQMPARAGPSRTRLRVERRLRQIKRLRPRAVRRRSP